MAAFAPAPSLQAANWVPCTVTHYCERSFGVVGPRWFPFGVVGLHRCLSEEQSVPSATNVHPWFVLRAFALEVGPRPHSRFAFRVRVRRVRIGCPEHHST